MYLVPVFVLFIAGRSLGEVVVALSPLDAGHNLGGTSAAISTVLQAELAGSQKFKLVEREQMNKALGEMKLNAQGMVAPESAAKIGKIVGAQYFCSGSLIDSDGKTMAVVKVIEIETTMTKLNYAYLQKDFSDVDAGKTLASHVEKIIAEFEKDKADRVAKSDVTKSATREIPVDWKRPTVMVIIPEMHLRHPQLIDPAGETEIVKRLIAANFKVVDSEYVRVMKTDEIRGKKLFGSLHTSSKYAADKKADILLYGEAISELGTSLDDFKGCRGRVELKAIKTDGDEILLSDSAEGGATDLAETIAGKKAIQQAANRLADTFLYSLAEKWNKKK
jgi:hypothetical protein